MLKLSLIHLWAREQQRLRQELVTVPGLVSEKAKEYCQLSKERIKAERNLLRKPSHNKQELFKRLFEVVQHDVYDIVCYMVSKYGCKAAKGRLSFRHTIAVKSDRFRVELNSSKKA